MKTSFFFNILETYRRKIDMKLSSLDIFLATICAFLVLLPTIFATWVITIIFSFTGYYLPTIQILFFIIFFFSFSIFILYIIRVFCPLQNGVYNLSRGKYSAVWKLQGFLYIFNLGIFINSYLVPVNIRGSIFSLLGSQIGRNVMIGGKIIEPALVSIGDFTILGEDTLITAHAKEGNKVELGRIKIGKEVTIGVKAIILPGVTIGDHAIVAAGAVVKKGTNIPANEIWGGIPAKKIGLIQ